MGEDEMNAVQANLERYTAYPTQPGWYCLGMRDLDSEIQLGSILEFADDEWFDEEGEPVDRLWDSVLDCWVSISSADCFVPQS
jgi:hypothetical protein